MEAIAKQRRDEIIQHVAQGVRLTDIIRNLNLGVSPQAVSRALQNDPDYKQAREFALAAILDKREEEMERAPDSVDVARARELLAQARWRAERECPHLWGQKGQLTVTHQSFSDVLKQLSEEQVIDVTPETVGVTLGVSEDKRTNESDNNQ